LYNLFHKFIGGPEGEQYIFFLSSSFVEESCKKILQYNSQISTKCINPTLDLIANLLYNWHTSALALKVSISISARDIKAGQFHLHPIQKGRAEKGQEMKEHVTQSCYIPLDYTGKLGLKINISPILIILILGTVKKIPAGNISHSTPPPPKITSHFIQIYFS
jgi:hypothetical protein